MDKRTPVIPSIRSLSESLLVVCWTTTLFLAQALGVLAQDDAFSAAAQVLEQRCLSCHAGEKPKGALGLETLEAMLKGGESGPTIVPGNPDASVLIDYVVGDQPQMPKNRKRLEQQEIDALKAWIAQGAKWPQSRTLEDRYVPDAQWWSLSPLVRPIVPAPPSGPYVLVNPIDAFIVSKLAAMGLPQSPRADRQTLIRRLAFDLIGLPPTPQQVDAFVNDPRSDDRAYSDLVDQFLASPHYGERWARHWLDVVHFGETHGYDKDKLRPNAWPYRDYVIRSFNSDKPYSRFIQEQIAGDSLYPETVDGLEALGFISAGPWDFIGHAEVPETKIDGKIARHLDRDDMVATTIGTFNSLTVGCAQCHNHKFDPISQKDYYRLQSVFAALDRADRAYDSDPEVASKRREIERKLASLTVELKQIDDLILQRGGRQIAELDHRILDANKSLSGAEQPEFGYHSQIENREDVPKWVQVDLGEPKPIGAIELVGCHDTFNNIGAGFGFPVRFLVQASDDKEFSSGVTTLIDRTREDYVNPGVKPQRFMIETEDKASAIKAQYVRVTATKLVNRLPNDYIFALAELSVYSPEGLNTALGKPVDSLDSIEAGPRWQRKNLVDGYYFGRTASGDRELQELQTARQKLVQEILDPPSLQRRSELQGELTRLQQLRQSLPPQRFVYSGMVYSGSGAFVGTGSNGGKPRSIYVLDRGNVTAPKEEVRPGALNCLSQLEHWFELPEGHIEADRRAALAHWISDRENPLTWRSIVNRVWQYHFGRGIVETSNDFGRMGAAPTHPELLDWLAVEFRDGGESFKRLHKLIVMSHTYRQMSSLTEEGLQSNPEAVDVDNRFLWRANRRRLEAEAIRDAVLQVSGKLNLSMGGPSFQDFVIEHPEHSPHFVYERYNPEDLRSHRRSIYRFLVRSQPQPFMTTLDCADPSMRVEKRNESLSPLQALAMLNNGFMVSMSSSFAGRLEQEEHTPDEQVQLMYRLAFGRKASDQEQDVFKRYIAEHGLVNACRLIFNLNEFSFVD